MQEERNPGIAPDMDAIIEGAVGGNADDFGKLYDLCVNRVYRHIYYRVGNTTDAEDLTQQVFLKAWKAIGRYKKTASPFIAWLIRISHNMVIDYYRSKKDISWLDDEPEFQDSAIGPERLAENNFNQQELRKVIFQLPEDQQHVILMSFIEGFSYAEIAAAMGKKEGNVRVILHRALKRMRQMLPAEEFLG